MTSGEVISTLWTWTPFLLGGFGLNILISVFAMVMGTAIGAAVTQLRQSKRQMLSRAGHVLTELTRNIPTIVFQFYLVFMLPNEVRLQALDIHFTVPRWLFAAAALAVAVVGFTADNLSQAVQHWRQGEVGAALLFVPSWTSFLLITVIASSTASIIGVDELVSRCNAVIEATGGAQLMLPIYVYASLIFFLFCYPMTLLMRMLEAHLRNRFPTAPREVSPQELTP